MAVIITLMAGAAMMKANASHKNCPAPFPEQGRGDPSQRETMQTFKIVRACCEYNIEKGDKREERIRPNPRQAPHVDLLPGLRGPFNSSASLPAFAVEKKRSDE